MSTHIPSLVMVFAAGLGTRMRPLTLTCPKPLIRVNGRTLLDRCLDNFAQSGIEEAIVNVHWLADQIETHLAGRTHPHITIADERPKLLGQAGALRKLYLKKGDIPLFMCNTDSFWHEEETNARSNIEALKEAWDPEKMDLLLLLAPRIGSIGVEGRGDFWLTADGRLSRGDMTQKAPYVYTGVGIISLRMFAQLKEEVCELSPYLSATANSSRLYGLPIKGQWFHVGTPEALQETEEHYGWV